jgi:aminopeptidase-like protein
MKQTGQQIYDLASRLYPIQRSLTGDGVRQTLGIIKEHLPSLDIKSVPSGTSCFDWEIPKEWMIKEAYIVAPNGKKIADFSKNNLHIVSYSTPQRLKLPLEELKKYIYTLPAMPDAIPYVTSYYKESWGFCMSHDEFCSLEEGEYEVVIDSKLFDGVMNYGELIIGGKSETEVLISTYICHPSLANNEVSGPSLTTYLADWIASKKRKYSYRILFIPETIGSIYYLSHHLDKMQQNIVAGLNLTCIGDDRAYSFVATRYGNTLTDRAARVVLKNIDERYMEYSFLESGSDERKYNAPGVDLPVISLMRTKYGNYPEYHTSKDDLSVISHAGLGGGYEAAKQIIEVIEENERYKVTTLCEPQLGRRGLYPTVSTHDTWRQVKALKNLLAYCDGTNDLIAVCEIINESTTTVLPIVHRLREEGLLDICF